MVAGLPNPQEHAADGEPVQEAGRCVGYIPAEGGGRAKKPVRKAGQDQEHQTHADQGSQASFGVHDVQRYPPGHAHVNDPCVEQSLLPGLAPG